MSTSPRPPDLRHLIQVPKFLGHRPSVVHGIRGTTPSGHPVAHALNEGWTLLAFLSTSCDGCQELWDAFADPDHAMIAADLTTVVVTRGSTFEPPEKVLRLCGRASIVMSDDAWSDYGVHAGPFFVLVDGSAGRVATEGVPWSVEQIAEAVATARGKA